MTPKIAPIISAVIALVAATATAAQAADCNAMIAGYAAHLARDPSSVLLATVTTNQGDRHFASVAFGVRLKLGAGGVLETPLSVGGTQRFSDRQIFTGPADRLGLRIVPGAPPQIAFILLSWGNGENTGTAELCEGELMVGTIGTDTAFSIAFGSGR